MITKNATPAERILAALDESGEVENYSAAEIEQLPIEVIEQRLDELGVDRSVPPFIRDLERGDVAPAQKLIDALSEDEDGEDEIENLPLDEVTARLNESGLNHAAGLERVRNLVGATDADAERRRPCAMLQTAWVKLRWIAAAAALAAIICNMEYHNILLHRENVGLKAELQHTEAITKANMVELRQTAEKYADMTASLANTSSDLVSIPVNVGAGGLWTYSDRGDLLTPINSETEPLDVPSTEPQGKSDSSEIALVSLALGPGIDAVALPNPAVVEVWANGDTGSQAADKHFVFRISNGATVVYDGDGNIAADCRPTPTSSRKMVCHSTNLVHTAETVAAMKGAITTMKGILSTAIQ